MPKERFFRFNMITEEYIDELKQATNISTQKEKSIMMFEEYLKSLADNTILWHNERTCLESLQNVFINFISEYTKFILQNVLDYSKISVLIQVGYESFRQSFQNKLSKKVSIENMSDLLNRHTIDSPPKRIKVLDLEDVKLASQYLISNFYLWYENYDQVFSKKVMAVVKSDVVQFGRMPLNQPLNEGELVENPDQIPMQVEMYLKVEDDFQITEKEMKKIMKGKSSQSIPPRKREELIRKKIEAEKKEKIEKIMARELELINQELEEKISEIREENENLIAEK